MTNRPSLRAAIDAFCKGCIYDPGSGNGAWREQVEACSSANCPLHPVRPRSKGERAVSSRENAPDEPAPTDDAEPDVSANPRRAFRP
jgi:hypothetical protein